VGLFRAISSGDRQASDPYPNGRFSCNHLFPVIPGSSFRALLTLNKLPGRSGWQMTYKDLAYDLEALWYAIQWFQDGVYGLPMLDIVVERFISGDSGPTFYAERGRLFWQLLSSANVSVS